MPGDAADRIRMITLHGYRPAAGERALSVSSNVPPQSLKE